MAGLSRQAIETIVRGARDIVQRSDMSAGEKSLALMGYKSCFEGHETMFLNDVDTLREVMPSFIERAVKEAGETYHKPIGRIARAAFRQWLVLLLRRDEEIMKRGLTARLRRTIASLKLTAGFGSFQDIGTEHPNDPLTQAPLFLNTQDSSPSVDCQMMDSGENDADPFDTYWRFVDARLETLQFFGPAVYGKNVFDGLRALVQTYALVRSTARYHAVANGRDEIAESDVAYGVGVVDHSFGKCPLVQAHLLQSFEKFFDNWRYGALLFTIG